MPYIYTITKILLLLEISVTGSAQGRLAYYHNTEIEHVCQHRIANGWNDLNCQFPCQIASISNHIGEYWLIALPNCRSKTEYRLCLVVDCGNGDHLESLRAKNEVVEISGELATYCGYETYQPDTMIWRLE